MEHLLAWAWCNRDTWNIYLGHRDKVLLLCCDICEQFASHDSGLALESGLHAKVCSCRSVNKRVASTSRFQVR